jgi:hypothetical protein
MNVRKKVFPRNQNLKMNLMLDLLFQHSNVFSHDLLTKIIGLLNEVPFQRLVYRENLALINIKSVNLEYNTLGRLDVGTNESSTKSLMFQMLFFFILFID